MKFYFLAFKTKMKKKKTKKKIFKIKITAIFFNHFVLNILYYRLYNLQIYIFWRCELNRKDEKKYVEIQKLDFFRKQNDEKLFFSSPNVFRPYGLFS